MTQKLGILKIGIYSFIECPLNFVLDYELNCLPINGEGSKLGMCKSSK